MHDEAKTKEQLLAELFELRKRVSHLEKERVERKQAEEAVKAERKRFFNVLESLPALICLLTPDYHIAFANRAFRERFGEFQGRYCYDYCFGRSEPYDFCEAYKVLETGLPHHWEVTAANGSVMDAYDFPFTDVNGSPLILEMDIDITERKRAEQALKSASEKFKFFAYSVAHDLKSPAIGVFGLARRLSNHSRDVLDEKGRIYCDQILKVSEHIAALADKINIYIATKDTALLIETTSLTEILRTIREEFSAHLRLRQIDLFAPESDVEVDADRLSILRVFRNLIDNALKYGGKSLSRISIGYEASESLHTFWAGDNGKGLNETDAEKIFGLFQRNETSGGVEGAGLGLAIVREIAERHGGRVWAESSGNNGATFYVSISKNLRPVQDAVQNPTSL